MADESFESLSRRLEKIADQVGANAERAIKGSALVADSTLVLGTPVDTGRARAGWQVSFGSPALADLPATVVDQSGASTIAVNEGKILQFKIGPSLFIANSVPYIARLDQGYSQQAPEGFSRAAVEAALAFLRKFEYLE